MKQYQKILAKIEKIERLLSEVKEEIKQLEVGSLDNKERPKREKTVLTSESLREDFDNLYKQFIENGSTVVNIFLEDKDLLYLKDFCKANNITLDSKNKSKDKIALEIIQWFVQRKAISKRM